MIACDDCKEIVICSCDDFCLAPDGGITSGLSYIVTIVDKFGIKYSQSIVANVYGLLCVDITGFPDGFFTTFGGSKVLTIALATDPENDIQVVYGSINYECINLKVKECENSGNATSVPGEDCICVTQTMIDGLGGGGQTLSGTYAQISAALTAGIDTTIYDKVFITDRSIGLFLDTSINPTHTPTLSGWYNALNPDFQKVGVYSGVAGYTLYNGTDANSGVWFAADEGTLVDGNVTFWNGNHYVVTDAGNFAGTDPASTPTAYSLLTPSVTNGYIAETDDIEYDFTGDLITQRNDKRSNRITDEPTYSNIPDFQWGNDNVKGIVCQNGGYWGCINQRGGMSDGAIYGASITTDNTHEGQINNTTIINGGGTLNFASGFFASVNLFKSMNFQNVLMDYNVANGEANPTESTLTETLDVSDPSIFAANVLTIPSNKYLIGKFLITGGNPTINSIVKPSNMTSNFIFTIDAGVTVTINSGNATNEPRLKSTEADPFVGVGNNNDFIEFTTQAVSGLPEIFESDRGIF